MRCFKIQGRTDFPISPVVKTLPSTAGGTGLTPGWRLKILHVTRCGQKVIKIISEKATTKKLMELINKLKEKSNL